MKKLTKEETLAALEAGHKIKNQYWKHGYAYLSDGIIYDEDGDRVMEFSEVWFLIENFPDSWYLIEDEPTNDTESFLKEADETWESFRKCLNAYPIEEGHNELRTHAQTLGIIWEQMVERIKTESK